MEVAAILALLIAIFGQQSQEEFLAEDRSKKRDSLLLGNFSSNCQGPNNAIFLDDQAAPLQPEIPGLL